MLQSCSLNIILTAMDDIVSLEAKWSHVWPRLVLFRSTETRGEEKMYRHHFIVVTFRGGISFVLDFADWQFGFSKVLYTLKEYEHEALVVGAVPKADDIWDYIDDWES
jgi:hypothetical protein